ncbi:MAG: DUF2764 family protein [Methylobacter sp.]|uniref:DUF2764 family protein n=1 Tax=Methylobacter sp. TaxID=2051955 RepID=UPI002731BDBC|nr:DUF2764 family protein [Methylobacter sp.]MDP1665334.1 DUF2764 family protein [Methylobacter sp.]
MTNYYTVVASFPHLPYFADAERLPLSRLRLEQRLRMLETDQSRQIFQAEFLAGWRLSAGKLCGGNIAAQYKTGLQRISEPVLREFVEYRLDIQTVVAALRIRQAGRDPEQYTGGWGVGHWVKHIEAHWDAADFRLGTVYPWVNEADSYLAAADAMALDRLLMDTVWRKLSRLGDMRPFGFEAITAFVFKWDILQAWLQRDASAAKQRFQVLIEEIKHVQ